MIKSIHLKSYGQFDDRTLHFTSGMNLIYAENEGGKSTLFSAMEAALLGFIPAGQNHPYFPWDGKELSLEVELFDGRRILRKMTGSISGFIQEGEHLRTISNQPLEGLSREYFRAFHLLEAEDLLDLEKNSMDQVIEGHLASLYSGGGTSPQEMLRLLEERRNRIYKKRGSNFALYEVNEALTQLQREELHYEEREVQLKEKKRQLKSLLENQIDIVEDGPLYPKDVEALNWDIYAQAKEIEKREIQFKKKQDELHESLLEDSLSTTKKSVNPRAYSLLDKKMEVLQKEASLEEERTSLEESLYSLSGYRSLELDKVHKIKPFTYRATMISFILLLLVGSLGGIFQKPEILSLLLPVLLFMYFFFQSWKNQLKEANLPGFFFSPKKIEDLSSLGKQWKILASQKEALEKQKEEIILQETDFLSKENQPSFTLEEYVQQGEEDGEKSFLHIRKQELLQEKREIEEQWTALGEPLSLYRPIGMDRLKKDLQWKEQSFKSTQEREGYAHDIARLRLEIEKLEEEIQDLPPSRQLLLDEKDVLMEEYNRAIFLSTLIEEGYKEYKVKLLPKLLERTSELFKAFTGGHYDGVMSSKEGQLFLVKADEVFPLKESMSKGLRSQFYLALRIALAELVDENLPMFFDEAFSNWDELRLEPTLRRLQELPRQQFIFSCKRRDRDLFQEILGVKAIHL